MKASRLRTDLAVRALALVCALALCAAQARPAFAPTLFGLFFEDINFGADGGLYPERVKNRSFEFPDALMGWQKIERAGAGGSLTVLEEKPLNENNSHYLRMEAGAGGRVGVTNEGFRGMGF